MRSLSVGLSFLAAAVAVACSDDPALTAAPAQLAQAWSGSTASPLCRAQGPNGEALDAPGARYCEWRLSTGSPRDDLTGVVSAEAVVVSWVRLMEDADAAARFTDSLRLALEERGLTPRECQPSVSLAGQTIRHQWDGPGLSVNVSRLAARVGGRVQVTATTGEAAMPPALCPDRVP